MRQRTADTAKERQRGRKKCRTSDKEKNELRSQQIHWNRRVKKRLIKGGRFNRKCRAPKERRKEIYEVQGPHGEEGRRK